MPAQNLVKYVHKCDFKHKYLTKFRSFHVNRSRGCGATLFSQFIAHFVEEKSKCLNLFIIYHIQVCFPAKSDIYKLIYFSSKR